MKNKIAVPIATWFGCGYAPKAPGTVGSAAAVAIAWALSEYAGWTPLSFAALAAASTPAAMWASGATACYVKKKDPGIVVVDEVVGQWMAFAGAGTLDWKTYLAGFLLFRLFDIVKPPPVRQLEKLPGGVGIVADDVAAGAYAALVLFLARCFNL
jgi:phosphatidylglycerophosphatase A